jgi:hypothetical protein
VPAPGRLWHRFVLDARLFARLLRPRGISLHTYTCPDSAAARRSGGQTEVFVLVRVRARG